MEQFPLNKKESGINRVVGFESNTEEEFLTYFKNRFETNPPDLKEKEKTPEQLEIINRINHEMQEFLAQYGVKAIEILPDNIHILDRSKFTEEELKKIQEKNKTELGFYSATRQSVMIIMDYNASRLSFLQTLIHEIMHLQGFYSFQKSNRESANLTLKRDNQTAFMNVRRVGFSVGLKDGKKLLFDKINESMTTELAIRFEEMFMVNWPELEDEIKTRDEYIKHVSERDNINIELVRHTVAGIKKNESGEYRFLTHTYHDERKQLNLLINNLFDKNKDDFETKEQIFTLFANATINGNLLPIARLIEKTFGKGSFRTLGEKSADKPKQD
ncbi:MAG: hypothetical protein PHN69_03695 [Candidatus Pacebacteria bacterium]|nr:hypothetical protein [Candidatus Paceibacterota bacterium]